jgi:ribosomal protein L21E
LSIRRFSATSISSTGSKSSKLWDQETSLGFYESIASAVVDASSQSTIIFDNLPQNYTHLQLRITARSNRDYNGNSGDVVYIQINNSISPTATHWLYGQGGSVISTTNNPYLTLITDVSGGSTYTHPSNFGVGIVDILDYSNTNKNTTMRAFSGFDTNGGPNNGDLGASLISSNFYNTTAAVTKLTLGCLSTFQQHSSFALYGIRGA